MPTRLTADDVVAAAQHVIATDGIDALSVRRVAGDLSVSRQVVYTHFDGMPELLDAVHRRLGLHFMASASEIDGSGDERLVRAARVYVDYARTHPSAFGLMFEQPVRGYRPGVETTAAIRAGFGEHVVGLMRTWCDDLGQTLPERELFRRARVFWSSLHGLVTLERSGHASPVETDDLVDSLMSTLVAGWRADAENGGRA